MRKTLVVLALVVSLGIPVLAQDFDQADAVAVIDSQETSRTLGLAQAREYYQQLSDKLWRLHRVLVQIREEMNQMEQVIANFEADAKPLATAKAMFEDKATTYGTVTKPLHIDTEVTTGSLSAIPVSP